MTPTETVLDRLLKQNVGRGSAWPGARCQWEVNAGVDLAAQPHAVLDVCDQSVRVTLSTFHYLDHFLEYDARLDKIYQAWQQKREWRRGQADMRSFATWIEDRCPALGLSRWADEQLAPDHVEFGEHVVEQQDRNRVAKPRQRGPLGEQHGMAAGRRIDGNAQAGGAAADDQHVALATRYSLHVLFHL